MALTTPWTAMHPRDDFGLPVSKQLYSATLPATTDTTVTVPAQAPRYMAVIKVEGAAQVYMALNQTAEAPVGASFAATTSEMVPYGGVLCREVKKNDVLHFITAGTDIDVSIAFYALQTSSGI